MPILINMDKARAIHMEAIRRARNVKLAQLDVPYLQALERGDRDAQTSIAKQKQTLRDIPQRFRLTGAVDPEGLIALWPDELPRE